MCTFDRGQYLAGAHHRGRIAVCRPTRSDIRSAAEGSICAGKDGDLVGGTLLDLLEDCGQLGPHLGQYRVTTLRAIQGDPHDPVGAVYDDVGRHLRAVPLIHTLRRLLRLREQRIRTGT